MCAMRKALPFSAPIPTPRITPQVSRQKLTMGSGEASSHIRTVVTEFERCSGAMTLNSTALPSDHTSTAARTAPASSRQELTRHGQELGLGLEGGLGLRDARPDPRLLSSQAEGIVHLGATGIEETVFETHDSRGDLRLEEPEGERDQIDLLAHVEG